MNRPVEDVVLSSVAARQTLNTIAAEASGTEYWYILLLLAGWDYSEIARHRGVAYGTVYDAVHKAKKKWLRLLP